MDKTRNYKQQNVVYYVLGIIEVILAFRLIFKLLAANSANSFVSMLYSLTGIFIFPFIGIFRTTASAGAVFEPATAIAILFYMILAYGIIKLIQMI